MENMPLAAILTGPLTLFFGSILAFVGIYSVTINVADATRLDHRAARKLALVGGWCYIAAGTAIIVVRLIF